MSESSNSSKISKSSPALRRRKAAGFSAKKSGSSAGMMKMYTEDTPGLRVDPVVVLVLSLIFIASVFALHIWGKFIAG